MAYLGNNPTTQSFTSGTDYFSGTGSQTAFTLTRTVNSVNDIEVVINNVVQQPSTAYTLSGTTVTFTSAPSSGTNNIYVRYLATNMQSFTVSANSIDKSKLSSDLQAGFQGRNRIINGHMVIDQRNAGASVSADNSFPVDRFKVSISGSATATAQQSSTVPVGFAKSLVYTVGTGAAQGTSSVYRIFQAIEGFNTADLNWGTANAKTVTVSFWVRSSVTGTFSGSLNEANGGTASYVFEFSVNSANTWEQKSITITGATVGTWQTTNSASIAVVFDLGSGTNYQQTAGSWTTSANKFRSSGSIVLSATSGATFYITGVQLEEGTTATSFEREIYSTTLQKCQRYYYRISVGGPTNSAGFGISVSTTQSDIQTPLPVTMRASPTANYGGTACVTDSISYNLNISSISQQFSTPNTSRVFYIHAATATVRCPATASTPSGNTAYYDFTAEL